MTPEDIHAAFIDELTRVAPDIAAGDIHDSDHIQEDLGLDSMDVLNLVTALHSRFGVNITEPEYPQIATPSSAVTFIAGKLA